VKKKKLEGRGQTKTFGLKQSPSSPEKKEGERKSARTSRGPGTSKKVQNCETIPGWNLGEDRAKEKKKTGRQGGGGKVEQ